MEHKEAPQGCNAANEAYRGTYSSMKPLIAVIQSNEAYRGLMQLNKASHCRNAAQ